MGYILDPNYLRINKILLKSCSKNVENVTLVFV